MPVSSDLAPPNGLQVVIDFVNTIDFELAKDEIASASALGAWLADRDLLDTPAAAIGERDRAAALELREALRAAMLGHNGGRHDARAAAVLELVARNGDLSVRFLDDCSVTVQPRADGFSGALARLLVPVTAAAADGTWARVKACHDDGCRWAFYDHSRNRSGRWCDMAVCGNRTKVRKYRAKPK